MSGILQNKTIRLIVIISILLVLGTSLTLLAAKNEDTQMREQMLIKTSLAAVGIAPEDIATLSGTPADLSSPRYLSIKRQLTEYREKDKNIRFTYLIGRHPDGEYFFFVDSESPDSPDYSPPGQDYPEVTPPVISVFLTGNQLTAGPEADRWGTWVSGLIPIRDPRTGDIIAVYGMDMDARDWYAQVVAASVPPLAATIIVLILLLAFYGIRERDERERKNLEMSERVARESEERYRLIFTRSPIGIVQLDKDGIIVTANEQYAKIVGATQEKLIGFNTLERIENPAFLAGIKEALQGNSGYFEGPYHSVISGKDMYLRAIAQPLGTKGSGAIGIIEDITERKRSEEELTRLNEALSRQTRTLSILNKIIITANDATSLNELLEDILDVTLQLLDYDAGGIYLMQPGGNAVVACSRNLDPAFLDRVKTVSTDVPPYDLLFVKGLPLITDHYDKVSPEHAKNTGYISMASVPLVSKNEIIGALNVASKCRYTVSEDERQTLVSIGHELGTIIEKIRVEENLRETAQNLETLFNSVDDMVFVLDLNGNIVRINEAVRKRLHYEERELLNTNVLELHVPEGRDEALKTIRGMIAGTTDSCHVPVVAKDGTRIDVETKITRGWWENREVLIGVTRDITDRKRIEEALKELAVQKSEVKYRTLIESANEGIFVIQDGKIPYANPKALKIIGYPPQNLQDVTFDALVHPDDRPAAVQRHLDRLAGKPLEPLATLRVFDNTGNIHWLEINAVIIEWEGRPATLNFVTDISIRKKALEELEFRNVILSSQIESTRDGLLIVDDKGRIISFNQQFLSMWGLSGNDISGESEERVFQRILVSIAQPDKFLNTVSHLYKNSTEKSYDEILLNDDRIFDMYSSPMIGEADTYFGRVWYFRDITDKKRADMEIMESLQEKEILLNEIHHRVKNNLQVVSGLLYLQANQVKDREIRGILTSCRNRITSMALLHENLYQISDFSSVSMAPYLNNLVNYLQKANETPESLRLLLEVDEGIILDIDTGTAVGMIITELMTNAIKYAFPEGSPGTITLSLSKEGDKFHLVVRDNGKGLPEEFDINSSRGLGMRLVRNLVTQIRGTLNIQRSNGTTFFIVFGSGMIRNRDEGEGLMT